MKKCFLSSLPVLELPGEVVTLDAAWVPVEQAAAVQGGQVHAYAQFAVAHPMAEDWKMLQYLHATETLSWVLVATIDGTYLLRHPQHGSYATIASGGLFTTLPSLTGMATEERTPPWRNLRQRLPMHVDAVAPALAQELQQALLKHKSFPIGGLLEALGIQDAFLHRAAAHAARLRHNPALQASWTSDSFAADCDSFLVTTEAIVQGVQNAEAGITPRQDLDALLREANALAEHGDYAHLSEAIALLSTHAIYFPAAAREQITRTRTRIQEDLFDLGPASSDELDALFAGKIVDADAYSGDLD